MTTPAPTEIDPFQTGTTIVVGPDLLLHADHHTGRVVSINAAGTVQQVKARALLAPTMLDRDRVAAVHAVLAIVAAGPTA